MGTPSGPFPVPDPSGQPHPDSAALMRTDKTLIMVCIHSILSSKKKGTKKCNDSEP